MHAPALAMRVPRHMMHAPAYGELAAQLADSATALVRDLLGTGPTSRTAADWPFRSSDSLGAPELQARDTPFGRLRVLTLADSVSVPVRRYLLKRLVAQLLAKMQPHRLRGRHNAGA